MRRFLLLFAIVTVGLGFGSWLSWYWTPSTDLQVLIVDKSVVTSSADEHRALSWLLTYERYVPHSGGYAGTENFYGLVPNGSGDYSLRTLAALTGPELSAVTSSSDMLYIADTYGVSVVDWHDQYPRTGEVTDSSKMLVAGLDRGDLDALGAMLRSHRTVVAEFNTFAPPTLDSLRRIAQRMLGVRWTGWVGRSVASLDSADDALPRWVITTYRRTHGGSWPFGDVAGIVLANEIQDRIIILTMPGDLHTPVPIVHMIRDNAERFRTTPTVSWSSWFDIVEPDSSMDVVAYYHLPTTALGDSALARAGIPNVIPAMFERIDHRVFYFAGDFSRCPAPRQYLAYAKGSPLLRTWLYDPKDPFSAETFFWTWYYPMMRQILRSAATETTHTSGR